MNEILENIKRLSGWIPFLLDPRNVEAHILKCIPI